MKKVEAISLFEKHFNSTLTKFNLKLSSVESNKHDFSGKFLSDKVGIYFISLLSNYCPFRFAESTINSTL